MAIVYKPGEPLFLMQVIKSIRALATENHGSSEKLQESRKYSDRTGIHFLGRRYKRECAEFKRDVAFPGFRYKPKKEILILKKNTD